MQIKNVLTGLVGLAVLADAASIERRSPFGRALERRRGGNGANQGNTGNAQGNTGGNANQGSSANTGASLTLDANLVQTGSQSDGNNPGGEGQAASATDNENFINFCQGKTLTNGAQVKTGSCNGIPMGNIPSVNNMVSSIFVNPQNGDNLASNQTFNIQVQMINFAPGTFTNATSTYYSAPQDVDGNGNIIGHTHVTVQSMGDNQNPTQPLDPQTFVFFKGINDAGNGNGLLSATVDGGLPAGNYRLCSMSAAANHQPVLMPVAQRGAQDDCVRFSISDNGNGGNGNNAGNGNAGNGNDAGSGTNNAGTGNNGAGSTNNAGTGSTNNAGTGNAQTGDNNNNNNNGAATATAAQDAATATAQNAATATAAQSGQNGQGQNNGQTGQASQAAGQGRHRGGRKGGKGGKNAQAATSVAAGGAAAATAAPATAVSAAPATAASAAAVSNAASGAGGATAANALGGIAAPPVSQSGNADRPFEVQGNTFTTKAAAAQRACDIQNNQCADAVNSKSISGVSVGDCNNQITACVAGLS
ncbi:hypothetical protein ACQKWADRAFT_150958 [Trichoderma austrokoningii]